MELIDRQAAIDAVSTMFAVTPTQKDMVEDCLEILENQPTVEPKTGRWIDCGASDHLKCDQCGCRAGFWFDEENSSSWDLNMSEWMSNFCPNCGAKMGGDAE